MKKSTIDKLFDQFQPEIRKGFLDSIKNVTDSAVLSHVEEAIKLGDPVGALRAIGMDQSAFRPLEKALETAFENGGVTTAKSLKTDSTQSVFRFDTRDSRAEKFLREQSGGRIKEISDETRATIRSVLSEGAKEGRNPRGVALDLIGRINPKTKRREGGLIGLTTPQREWVKNASEDLKNLSGRYFSRTARDKRFDSIVQKAIDSGKPIPKATIDKLINRYKDNLLKVRAESIARTEMLKSMNASQHIALEQAVSGGKLSAHQIERVWDSTGDERVRNSHNKMDGQKVGLNDPFKTPYGYSMLYPGDHSLGAPAKEIINCRCRVRLAVNWLAGARDG